MLSVLPASRRSAPARPRGRFLAAVTLLGACAPLAIGAPPRIIAWNDLGMHCIDPDFSLFAILPPFNTINAHLLVNGQLVTAEGGFVITYEGVVDGSGSINTTSIGKTDFWDHAQDLFGVSLPLDVGLAGNKMPGAANTPQPTHFDPTWDWFQAEGIPITPVDDGLQKNTYPLMKITARNGAGQAIASTVTAVPNSRELDCRVCHSSGQSPFAKPKAGWAFDPNPDRDERLNILRLHDEHQQLNPAYATALQTAGFNPAGLYATAVTDGVSVLCATCHPSNALPGSGLAGVKPLTSAIHGLHANVFDATGKTLDSNPTRNACYSCHPGFDTQCLRGAMGKAIGDDGQFRMHCQSCHGGLAAVGDPNRVGWLEQPACQQCHTGTATQNAGAIRFTSVFDDMGNPHVPAVDTFATDPNVPAAGFSLYRFSTGHGELQCSTCHGSPHAIVPTNFANDNAQNIALQGHAGTLTDCSVCHGNDLEDNQWQGPHGMHPVTAKWVQDNHGDRAENNLNQCRSCHGQDLRGTVLSYAQGPRTFNTKFGTKAFFEGARVGCYHCHNGPNSENAINNAAPVAPNLTVSTPADVPLPIVLNATDANNDPLEYRVISQPSHGTAGVIGNVATYYPNGEFQGPVSFTYAAWDTKTNSNLATITVNVGPPDCAGGAVAYGFPCPGSGGVMPTISLDGCPAPAQSVTLSLQGGLGGTNAIVMIGAQPALTPLGGGCVLRISPIAITFSVPLSGSGPGAGGFNVPATMPANIAPGSFVLQAIVLDPGVPQGYSATNGLEVTIP